MKIEMVSIQDYEQKLNSNLYDYLLISDKSLIMDNFEEFVEIANKYNPDIIHCDYYINEYPKYGKTIIFSEMKSFPDFLEYAAIKCSVLKKFGYDMKKIIRPENNLLIWHIPKLLLTACDE